MDKKFDYKEVLKEAHKIAVEYGCADNPNWQPKEIEDE